MYILILNIYNFITALLRVSLQIISLFSTKNIELKERLLLISKDKLKGSTIWLHGASVGEVLSARALIEEIKIKYPKYSFIITTQTQSSKEIIQSFNLDYVQHIFLPLDNRRLIVKFLKYYKPKLVLWLEQDFFPVTFHTVQRYNIPFLLLNARMSDKSFRIWKNLTFITQNLLSACNEIFPMSKSDLKKYETLADRQLKYLGNLKNTNLKLENIDNVLVSDEYQELKRVYQDKDIIVFLSTHYNEEEEIIKIHNDLAKSVKNLITIIIPRHPKRTLQIMNNAKKKHIKTIGLYSKMNKNNYIDYDIILVDYIGKVDIFCMLAKMIFVGKTLSRYKKGGHNLLEPLSFKKPIIFGNNIDNFLEISQESLENNAGVKVYSYLELKNTIEKLLFDSIKLTSLASNTNFVYKNSDLILENYMLELEEYLSN